MDIKKIYLSREGRLSRIKFFIYILLLGIIFAVINSLLGRILPSMVALIVSIVLQLGLLFFIYPSLIYKRQQDRNLDGRKKMIWIWIIFTLTYVFSFVVNTINLSVLTSIQTEAQQYSQQLQSATTTGEQEKIYQDFQVLQQKAMTEMFTPLNIALYLAMFASFIRLIVLRRPLFFSAGTKGHNHYGADPLEKKKK